MNRINPCVVLLTLASVAAGFLIVEDRAATRPSNALPVATAAKSPSASAETLPVNMPPAKTLPVKKLPVKMLPVNTVAASNVSDSGTAESVRKRSLACRIAGLKAQPCNVYVAVFESGEGFPKSEYSAMTTIVPATDDHVELSLSFRENYPAAIAVFQDLDGNGRLSRNAIGLPTEPYGFSNNARSLMGPPSFEQAVIPVSDAEKTLEIRVR